MAEQVPTKYSDKDLEMFENKLLEMKAQKEADMQALESQMEEYKENGKDEKSLDNASYDIQIESIVSHRARGMKHLRDIENALMRVKNKVYGVCTVTGKLIDKRRLIAVPTTTKSLEGKQIMEQNEQ